MDAKRKLTELGLKIVDDARKTVPVDTGALKRSLYYYVEYNNNDDFEISFVGEHYGHYVNFGTSRQRAQPFLTNAINKNLSVGVDDIVGELADAIVEKLKINFKK